MKKTKTQQLENKHTQKKLEVAFITNDQTLRLFNKQG